MNWFTRIFSGGQKRNIQNPPQWLYEALGGLDNDSGINVTTSTAQTLSAFFAAVRLISTSIAQLPFHVYRRDGERVSVDTLHSADYLIHDEPNATISAMDFRETMQAHALLYGNAYALIERDALLRPQALWILEPSKAEVALDKRALIYQFEGKTYNPFDIIHVAHFGWDGTRGKSVIEYATGDIGLSLAAQKFAARFFKNGGNLGGWLEHPSSLGDVAMKRLQDSVNVNTAGAANWHRVKIFEEGMKFNKLDYDGEKAQMLQTRQHSVTEVARWFGLPPHMIGDLSRATFSNISSQDLAYVKHSVMPWIIKWEQAFNRKIFVGSERQINFTKFNLEGLLRADPETRAKFYQTAVLTGWMNRNEVRRLENLDPVDGLDEYLTPLNMNTKTNDDENTTKALDGHPLGGLGQPQRGVHYLNGRS